MPVFCQGIPRWLVLYAVAGLLFLLPPEILAQGPALCLWRKLFQLPVCPACGTTRALCAFFHGELPQAVAFNANVLVTAPAMVALIVVDTGRLVRKVATTLPAILNSLREMSGVFKPE